MQFDPGIRSYIFEDENKIRPFKRARFEDIFKRIDGMGFPEFVEKKIKVVIFYLDKDEEGEDFIDREEFLLLEIDEYGFISKYQDNVAITKSIKRMELHSNKYQDGTEFAENSSAQTKDWAPSKALKEKLYTLAVGGI